MPLAPLERWEDDALPARTPQHTGPDKEVLLTGRQSLTYGTNENLRDADHGIELPMGLVMVRCPRNGKVVLIRENV